MRTYCVLSVYVHVVACYVCPGCMNARHSLSGWGLSERGVSFTFGPDIIRKFLRKHDFDLLVRAHQVGTDAIAYTVAHWLVALVDFLFRVHVVVCKHEPKQIASVNDNSLNATNQVVQDGYEFCGGGRDCVTLFTAARLTLDSACVLI